MTLIKTLMGLINILITLMSPFKTLIPLKTIIRTYTSLIKTLSLL